MEARAPQIIPSGIEPADKLLGGLTSGELYLVHGEASGQSLFGMKFLIEGLKRGESGAIVIRYTPEDAVRRIAQLGYDCLEDVYSGRLVILEYSDDIIQQIAHLHELTPVLRELEWLLGETQPNRLVFDPVTSIVMGREIDLEARVTEFAGWAKSFGATVVMIASGNDDRVPGLFRPLVAESFRFEVRNIEDRITQFLSFEKNAGIADQPIEVDPSRGVFLLGGIDANPPLVIRSTQPYDEAKFESVNSDAHGSNGGGEPARQDLTADGVSDIFGDLFGDLGEPPLEQDAAYIELEIVESVAAPVTATRTDELNVREQERAAEDSGETVVDECPPGACEPAPRADAPTRGRRGRAADFKIDSTIAARAAEILLKAPASQARLAPVAASTAAAVAGIQAQRVDPKDFNVLIIDYDPASSQAMADALDQYTVEIVHDGISGLAKLISFKPDLIVLDVDLPVIDGFKVLEHIRQSLNMPIIIVSASHVRASDRVFSSELGADYYLTKPFSSKELRHKAKQLIARYRGIISWIINPQATSAVDDLAAGRVPAPPPSTRSGQSEQSDHFLSYDDFSAEVQRRVRAVMEKGDCFSIVGCSLPEMTAERGRLAIRLFELVRSIAREADLSSTNPKNDLVVLLEEADAQGARAFADRLRERVRREMSQELSIWMRTFPEPEAETEAPSMSMGPASRNVLTRRGDDDQLAKDPLQPSDAPPSSSPSRASATSASAGGLSTARDGA